MPKKLTLLSLTRNDGQDGDENDDVRLIIVLDGSPSQTVKFGVHVPGHLHLIEMHIVNSAEVHHQARSSGRLAPATKLYGTPNFSRTALMFLCLNSTEGPERFRSSIRNLFLCAVLLIGLPASSSWSMAK
jgi:hypothetical protein